MLRGLGQTTEAWSKRRNLARLVKYPLGIIHKLRAYPALLLWARRADCFLVSYPKSGRTWLRYILSFYLAAAFGKGTETDLYNMFAVVPNFDLDPVRGIPAFLSHAAAGKVPMVLVSHKARSKLPGRRPVVIMVRDPRDVLVSAYFHATRHKGHFSGSLSDFIDDREYGMPQMISYLNGWGSGLSGRRHHIVSYERLSADPVREVTGVLNFLGCEIKPEFLDAAVNAGQFEKMKEMEVDQGIPGHQYDRSDMESLRMRKGRVGGFSDYLNDEEIARIEAYCIRDLTPAAKALLKSTGEGELHQKHPLLVAN